MTSLKKTLYSKKRKANMIVTNIQPTIFPYIGGEALHASMAVLERRGRGIRHKETQLKVIMSSQHIQASPILHECEPLIKKRKVLG